MTLQRRTILISLGISLGLIFLGINLALTNFNRLVSPEEPLRWYDCRVAGDKVDISLLGNTWQVSLNERLPDEVQERARGLVHTGQGAAVELLRTGQDEAEKWFALVRQKVREMTNRP